MGIEPWPQEARVLPLCHRGPQMQYIKGARSCYPGCGNCLKQYSVWREAVAGIVFSNDPISNCMNYATYWFIRFTIAVFYNIHSPLQQISVLISLIFP